MKIGDKMLENINVQKNLNILFMGTPDFSVPVLEGLIENYKIRAVITQPDRLVGRDQKMISPPIKVLANKHTILVLQPENIKLAIEEVLGLEPDLIITCAYGQILPDEILKYPKYGCINVHASLLPKLRGGAPIHKAIIEGYEKTGITIMHMATKMDAGDIISKKEVEIDINDTASTLHDKLKIVARDLLLETMPAILNKTADRIKQNDDEATYAFTIKREDERIKFDKTKKQVYNQIRGLNEWPGAYCLIDNKILKVWESYMTDAIYPKHFNGQITKIYKDGIGVKVSNGEIVFKTVQPEGKSKMSAFDFANGYKDSLVDKIL
jgi:methionyl-tRNA formyltransferase